MNTTRAKELAPRASFATTVHGIALVAGSWEQRHWLLERPLQSVGPKMAARTAWNCSLLQCCLDKWYDRIILILYRKLSFSLSESETVACLVQDRNWIPPVRDWTAFANLWWLDGVEYGAMPEPLTFLLDWVSRLGMSFPICGSWKWIKKFLCWIWSLVNGEGWSRAWRLNHIQLAGVVSSERFKFFPLFLGLKLKSVVVFRGVSTHWGFWHLRWIVFSKSSFPIQSFGRVELRGVFQYKQHRGP